MQSKFSKWGLLTFMIIIFSSCKSESQVKWEKDMEITSYHGGGMVPESKTVIIKNGTGKYIHWWQSRTDTFSFTLSQPEMDELVKRINATHFTAMRSGETGSIAYDKPTTSVTLKWDGQTHKVSVGATEGITHGEPQDFNQLYGYILSFAEKKTGQRKA